MKDTFLYIILFSISLLSCNSNAPSAQSEIVGDTVFADPNNTLMESQVPSDGISSVDLCKCLTEPGNSEWAIENRDACNNLINLELGVANWEKVNFSKEPELNRKWDELVERCSGSSLVETGVEQVDKNNELVPEIGTAYGYIWEYLDTEAQIYTTLAFDGLIFRSIAYAMNGETNSGNFTKIIEISGSWTAVDAQTAEGVIKSNNVPVSWMFSSDYTSLTNNKGVVFQRVQVK
jgi:hypothetical protein